MPTILKMLQIRKVQPGLEWSQTEEMAMDIPLLNSQRFHSVFTCPVSKEQGNLGFSDILGTVENPPMIITCGHVISKESLARLCKGNVAAKIKCPYCPSDSTAAMAMLVHF